MPRLSLYKPEKGPDYRFLDKNISEMFQVGGTDVFIHKYLGPKTPEEGTADQPAYDVLKETNIQDLLFLENRDRVYDPDIYRVRGIYNVQDIDFNLTQFGLFLENDTVFMTLHINDSVKTLGRKIMAGDVFELPHLVDQHALTANDFSYALKRFFVVEDVNRAAEGFSATWWPHLYRVKLKKISDTQEFKDILDQPAAEDTDTTIRDLISTKNRDLEINQAILDQAEADAPKSGYDTSHYYTLAVGDDGKPVLATVDDSDLDASDGNFDVSRRSGRPTKDGYTGYLLGDGLAPNGVNFGSGIDFPLNADEGDFYLRLDFKPNRLFRYSGNRWVKYEDEVRHTLSNTNTRNTLKTSFINNNATSTIAGEVVEERQSLSKALKKKPEADF
jgi:hypothetical protein